MYMVSSGACSGHKKSPSESGRSTAPRYHPNSGNKNIAGSQRTYNGAAGIGYRRHCRFDLSCYEAKRLHARTTAFSRGGLSVERLCVKANFITAFINFSISHLPSVFKSFRKKSFKNRKIFRLGNSEGGHKPAFPVFVKRQRIYSYNWQ